MNLKRIMINCMAQSETVWGPKAVFLVDPSYGTKFRSCAGFRRFALSNPKKAPERQFTVRLHFAETGKVKPGECVFDVSLQGKPVLKDFDVVREAGRDTALVKEFQGVKATDEIAVDLLQKPGAKVSPAICGVEIMAEK